MSTKQNETSLLNPCGFEELGLSAALVHRLGDLGYTEPTPIQSEAIPVVLKHDDLLGCAQTGTGKTAAFALPLLEILNKQKDESRRRAPRVLVLAPTRELAAQIAQNFMQFAGSSGPKIAVVFGGVSKQGQIQKLRRGVDVLVATPGRLLDLANSGLVKLNRVRHLVLDEADRMLDMGFIGDIKKVAASVCEDRQTLLFSATMPPDIEALAKSLQKSPIRLEIDPISSTGEPIEQSIYYVEKSSKAKLLETLLNSTIERALVFTRTKHGANRLTTRLSKAGFECAAIHSNKSQTARQSALRQFKAGRLRAIIATDIAARGIDIKELPYVVNYDLPEDPESYVHRVGRTGRAGAVGIALSFCSQEEHARLRAIEKLTQKRLSSIEVPEGIAAAPKPQRQRTPRPSDELKREGPRRRAKRQRPGRKKRMRLRMQKQSENSPS